MANGQLTYIVDTKLKMAACVIIQALYRCDRFTIENFAGDDWVVYPTSDMRRISGTPEQWKELAKKWRVENEESRG